MKNAVLLFVFGVFALTGCTRQLLQGEAVTAIFMTRPKQQPPADTEHQIQEHETWCYKTMADPECYAHAQDVPPNRLINSEPQNLHPLTPQAYKDEVAGRRPSPATGKPVDLGASGEKSPEKKNPAAETFLIERMTGYPMPFLHVDYLGTKTKAEPEAKPAEPKPAPPDPVELIKPADSKPIELIKPVEPKPTELKPAKSKPAKPKPAKLKSTKPKP